MKNIIKKISTMVLGVSLLVATMGVTAMAASGNIYGSLNGTYGSVTLQNTSGNIRYCVITLRQYNSSESNYSTVSANSGNLSSGNTITTSGPVYDTHAVGVGYIYNSGSSNSGVALTKKTYIK